MDPELKSNEEDKSISEISSQKPVDMLQSDKITPAMNNSASSEMAESLDVEQQQVGDAKPETQMPKFRSAKKGVGKTVLLILLILLLVAGGVAAFLWRDMTAKDSETKLNASITSLNKTVATLKTELAAATSSTTTTTTTTNTTGNGGTTTCTSVAPIAATIDNIKASITSGNTAALEGYMAASVNVVLASSGGVVAGTPTQSVGSITDFITGATAPWNFALSSSVLGKYSAGGFSKYFPSIAVVGQSANGKVISFNFDCNGKINSVLLSSSPDLIE